MAYLNFLKPERRLLRRVLQTIASPRLNRLIDLRLRQHDRALVIRKGHIDDVRREYLARRVDEYFRIVASMSDFDYMISVRDILDVMKLALGVAIVHPRSPLERAGPPDVGGKAGQAPDHTLKSGLLIVACEARSVRSSRDCAGDAKRATKLVS
jgi:hypothetical protein